MANPEHVAIVRKGAACIEEWRQKHPEQTLDLFQAQLPDADLSGANLTAANLFGANLIGANLSKANLSGANLVGAYIMEANLSRANLSKVNFSMAKAYGADFSGANLSEAELVQVNLHKANLSKANLSGASLEKSTLFRANLSGANLSKADLSFASAYGANFSGVICSGADLFGIDLSDANLSKADLSGTSLIRATLDSIKLLETNLSNTDLRGAKLLESDASNVNLTGAIMSITTLGGCNLAHGVGLETVKHEGPSNIDVNTLIISFRRSGNCFTSELKTFFLNSGIPKELLETLPRILAEVQYCTCFVCYGQPDLGFAERLVKDLKERGVSCWLYSMDATPGKKVWGEIIEKRREAEKMIILCSAEALVRDGVLKEIEEQIDEDPDKMVPISLDNLWKENGFSVKRGKRDLKPSLLERNYADFTDESMYNNSFRKLLRGLKRT
ncbi:MAG: pentapeptide repeat-containing protein [Candidatus Bathyarchaeota archaeon]|nr:MAG: pentapeptide repeat-containing protein [Candidatus Bathyarchaeota archaeon]